ncbi:MAG: hypothetical protein R3C20_12700 [Planctomycetaceae bacterium]
MLQEAVASTGTRLLSYCLMGNHWYLVVWPREEGELSRFVGWLTLTHTQRWHADRHRPVQGTSIRDDSNHLQCRKITTS